MRRLAAVLAGFVLSGCAAFGPPKDSLSIPTLIKVSMLYGRLQARLSDACAVKALPDATCADLHFGAAQLETILDASQQALISGQALDPAQVQRALDAVLKLAGGLGPLGLLK